MTALEMEIDCYDPGRQLAALDPIEVENLLDGIRENAGHMFMAGLRDAFQRQPENGRFWRDVLVAAMGVKP